MAGAIRRAAPNRGSIVEVAFPISGALLQSLYRESSAVLANSGFEPFGPVGLEAMAAGGVVVTGATREDYVEPFRNGFALDTDDPVEIVRSRDWLARDPAGEPTDAHLRCLRR